MRSCFAVARLQLMAEAATFGQPLSDLACTLLMAVLGRQMTLLGQIGDGAMVLASHHDETLYVPIRPQLGDGEGVTTRLTDEGAVGLLQIREFPEPARHAAVFTPGLRRLALRWGDEVGHKPFFQPFFDVLQTAEDGDQARLDDALATFLRSPTVRQRTEDDVTLLVASWTGFPPPILPGE